MKNSIDITGVKVVQGGLDDLWQLVVDGQEDVYAGNDFGNIYELIQGFLSHHRESDRGIMRISMAGRSHLEVAFTYKRSCQNRSGSS